MAAVELCIAEPDRRTRFDAAIHDDEHAPMRAGRAVTSHGQRRHAIVRARAPHLELRRTARPATPIVAAGLVHCSATGADGCSSTSVIPRDTSRSNSQPTRLLAESLVYRKCLSSNITGEPPRVSRMCGVRGRMPARRTADRRARHHWLLQQAQLACPPHGVSTLGDVQLGQDRRDMMVDGLDRQIQPLSEFRVGQAVVE